MFVGRERLKKINRASRGDVPSEKGKKEYFDFVEDAWVTCFFSKLIDARS